MDLLEQLQIKPQPKKEIVKAIFTTTEIIDATDTGYNRESFMQKILQQRTAKKIPTIPTELPEKRIIKKQKKKLAISVKKEEEESEDESEDESKDETEKDEIIDIDDGMKIGADNLKTRMPPPPKPYKIKASPYYLNNREKFINSITSFFNNYRKDLKKESSKVNCDKKVGAFSLLTHQKIIKDYMNIHSPYRGLLVYHGLGSGKTCSSIAIAEGFKSNRQIVVLTPASLQMNYRSELQKCGDALYTYNQHWEFVPLNDEKLSNTLRTILSIPESKLKSLKLGKQNGLMFVNANKPSNYTTLSTEEKNLLNKQIKIMIETKYKFINYNGLRDSHFKEFKKKNPFDNKVIIIDEVHNFVSMIANKINDDKALSVKLYKYLLNAKNARLIFLTGTPVINYPNELGILFNMLRGYIRTYTMTLIIDKKPVKKKGLKEADRIKNIVKQLNLLDIINYIPRTNKLTITRNPFGFVSIYDKEKYTGVELNEQGNVSDNEMLIQLESLLKKHDISILSKKSEKVIEIINYTALPDTLTSFKNMFIKKNTDIIQNKELLKRRILGLTSYFRSAQEQLLPKYNKEEDFHIIKIPMSTYQVSIYEEARKNERKTEKNRAKNKKRAAMKGSNVFDIGASTYRLFSRAFCNFVFPREIERPMPEKDFDEEQNTSDTDPYIEQKERALLALQTNAETHLSKEGLKSYSPKFLSILNNLQEKDGLHLIYSQFRTLEGIGILKLILEANGFAEFKIAKNKEKEWYVVPTDKGKSTFTLYTGTESTEEKEIIRNIFNDSWDKVPTSIVNQLEQEKKLNNKHGEIIKTFMITSAGAEGISLRNVRYVHITEPYWHPVRIEQVIGRARRICSHQDLPEKERNVEVFLYLMTFTKKQIDSELSIELKLKDTSKLVNYKGQPRPVTSDETLFEISTIKEKINGQLLNAVKESSIDCEIYNNPNCITFGKVSKDKYSYIPSYKDEDKDILKNLNRKIVSMDIIGVRIKGTAYVLNKTNNDVYDISDFKVEDSGKTLKLKKGRRPVIVGRLEDSETSSKKVFKRVNI